MPARTGWLGVGNANDAQSGRPGSHKGKAGCYLQCFAAARQKTQEGWIRRILHIDHHQANRGNQIGYVAIYGDILNAALIGTDARQQSGRLTILLQPEDGKRLTFRDKEQIVALAKGKIGDQTTGLTQMVDTLAGGRRGGGLVKRSGLDAESDQQGRRQK